MFIPAALLCVLLALLFDAVQERLRVALLRNPALVWLVSASLAALFCAAAYGQRCLSAPVAALIFTYTIVPTGVVYLQRQASKIPSLLDLLAILLLWLPLEFSVGAALIPRAAQGV